MGIVTIAAAALALFARDGTLEDNGWERVRDQRQDAFSVKGGVVTMVCSPNPYKGACYRRTLGELPAKGVLEYEIRPNLPGSAYSNRYYLQVCCGSMMMSFASQNVLRYFAKPKANWSCVGKDRLANGEWNRVRVKWDNVRKVIKFYVNDMRIPSCVEENATVDCDEGDPTSFSLRLGNYGLAEGFQTHQIRNLTVTAGTDETSAKVPRDTALVFRGLCSEYFPIDGWTKGYPADKVVDFFLEFQNYNYTPKNHSKITAYPDEDLCATANLIILADVPLAAETLAYSAQENLLAAVKAGARMIVTGGLVGLQRGGDFESPIAKALPVKLESPWKAPAGGNVFKRDYGKGKIAVIVSAPKAKEGR